MKCKPGDLAIVTRAVRGVFPIVRNGMLLQVVGEGTETSWGYGWLCEGNFGPAPAHIKADDAARGEVLGKRVVVPDAWLVPIRGETHRDVIREAAA